MSRFVTLAIVLFWLVMVGWLVRRTLPQPQPTLPPVPLVTTVPLQAQEEWMGIYHQNQKVGYLRRHLTPTTTGYQWDEQWRMRLRMLDTPQTIHTEIRAHTDSQYALTTFSFRLLAAGTVFQVTGEVANQELHGHITTGNETSPFSLPLRGPIYLPATTQMALRNAVPPPGEERRFSIFNPLSLRTDTITVITIGSEILSLKGEQRTVTKVAERFADTTVHAWLDQEGKVIKEEAALGLVLLRESREDALGGGWQDSTPLDLVTSTSIPVRHTLPDPRSLTYLRLKLTRPTEAIPLLFPPRQQQQDTTLTITREERSALATYPLPQTNLEFAADLAPTPFLQSTHPRLVAQAQQILGTERDALQVAQRILDWTYSFLEKAPTVGMPTALEALDKKKGDCNEHAVLFTALARAAGLPARVAAGVVYLDSAFYYHAWAEVWLGQWVAVDPVFRQFPADATHVKFVEGGPEHHMALLKVIGQVGIEIVEYKQ
jgi:hypothetical protein